MMFLLSVKEAVREVCNVEARRAGGTVGTSIGNYRIYINELRNPHYVDVLVHKIGNTDFPTQAFTTSMEDLRETLRIVNHGCLLEAFQ